MDDLFPPFAPDPNEPRPRRFKPVPFRMIAPEHDHPDGFVPRADGDPARLRGQVRARRHRRGRAAGVLDGIDGRVARLLKGTSRFGAELDSLADFVNFGCAPALILYGFSAVPPEVGRLDRGADLRHRHGAAARPLQRHAGRSGPAGLEEGFLRGHAGARGGVHGDAAALPTLPGASAMERLGRAGDPRSTSCCIALLVVSTVPTYLGQDHGQAGAAQPRPADLPVSGSRRSAS